MPSLVGILLERLLSREMHPSRWQEKRKWSNETIKLLRTFARSNHFGPNHSRSQLDEEQRTYRIPSILISKDVPGMNGVWKRERPFPIIIFQEKTLNTKLICSEKLAPSHQYQKKLYYPRSRWSISRMAADYIKTCNRAAIYCLQMVEDDPDSLRIEEKNS